MIEPVPRASGAAIRRLIRRARLVAIIATVLAVVLAVVLGLNQAGVIRLDGAAPGSAVPAQSASVAIGSDGQTYQVGTVGYSLAPKVRCHVWGCAAVFNKEASRLVAAGVTAAIGGGATGSWWGAAVGYEVAREAASQAVEHGNCLQINRLWNGPLWFWRAHC
jgi:hypothetical protein